MKKVLLVAILAILLSLTACGCSSEKSEVAGVKNADTSSAELTQLRKDFENYKIETASKISELQTQINKGESRADLIETAYKSADSIQKSAQESADNTIKSAYESADKTLANRIDSLEADIKNLKSAQNTVYPPATTNPPIGQFTATIYSGENFNSLVGSFSESGINHNWSGAGPLGLYEHYSVKWNGTVYFSGTRYYQFTVRVDDGARLYIDGKLEIDLWRTGSVVSYARPVYLTEGYHVIQVEYFQGTGTAVIELLWN